MFRSRVATRSNAGSGRRYGSHRVLYSTSRRISGQLPQKKTTRSASPLIRYYDLTELRTAPNNKQTYSYRGTICFPRGVLLHLFVYYPFIQLAHWVVGSFAALTCKGRVPARCHHSNADVYRQSPCTVPP